MVGAVLGLIFGFGAPIGSLIFRGFVWGELNPAWIREEVGGSPFFYFYMTLTTPVVFAAFGFFLGLLRDKVFSQKESLQRLNVILNRRSMVDDITGLYNHGHLLEVIEKEVERARRYQRTLSGMMIDIDDFKKVNDHLGHLVGDDLLREFSHVLKRSSRKIDILGRYGGDEFLVILPESTLESARHVAERIQENLRGHRFYTEKGSLLVTASIGLFSFQDLKTLDAATFIEKADQAMYKAKASGKNKIVAG